MLVLILNSLTAGWLAGWLATPINIIPTISVTIVMFISNRDTVIRKEHLLYYFVPH